MKILNFISDLIWEGLVFVVKQIFMIATVILSIIGLLLFFLGPIFLAYNISLWWLMLYLPVIGLMVKIDREGC